MVAPKKAWFYGYEDLMRLTGLGRNAIVKHVARGECDPTSLESVLYFTAKYGSQTVKVNLVNAAISRPRNAKNKS